MWWKNEGTHHGWTTDEGQQPAHQRLKLLDQDLRRVFEDRFQAGQSGQLDALVGTRQGLQQQRQELDEGRIKPFQTSSSLSVLQRIKLVHLLLAVQRLGPASVAYWRCWTEPSGSWLSSLLGSKRSNRRQKHIPVEICNQHSSGPKFTSTQHRHGCHVHSELSIIDLENFFSRWADSMNFRNRKCMRFQFSAHELFAS